MNHRMIRSCTAGALAGLAVAVVTLSARPGSGQAASSPTYLLVGAERAPGGTCATTNFVLDVAIGAGVVPERTASTSYVLLGGFAAALETVRNGAPWSSGVSPLVGPLLGGTAHALHGADLDVGPSTSVLVGGVSASVTGRAADRVAFTLPAQAAPGWKAVAATTTGGTSTLPNGIGVLPLVETPQPVAVNVPFRVTYRGTQGDVVYLAVANARFPVAIPVAPYHFGLGLHPGALLGVVGPLPVLAPDGVLHLDFPGLPLPRPLHVQMLGIPVASPGYGPGSFTNVLDL
jgi:hypothetical protein